MASRRTVLTGAAAGAAAIAAGASIPLLSRTANASAKKEEVTTGAAIPYTLANRRDNTGGTLQVTETSFPLSHLAVDWSGPGTPGIRIRTKSGWSDWVSAHSCQRGKDGVAEGQRRTLLTVPGAVGYEIASRGDTGNCSMVEINTVDGPTRTIAGPPQGSMIIHGRVVQAPYLNRAAWGADESLRFEADGTETWPAQYIPIQTLTVHHTAHNPSGVNQDPDPAATVRALYYNDTIIKGWGDIGYHMLIDENGVAYEGRYSGPDGISTFGPDKLPDGRPQMVNGAHAVGFNAGNVGVALLGTFTSQLPTAAARSALVTLLANLAGPAQLNPLGKTDYVNPLDETVKKASVSIISGHRDWNPTECPGNRFYPELPALRQEVAQYPKP